MEPYLREVVKNRKKKTTKKITEDLRIKCKGEMCSALWWKWAEVVEAGGGAGPGVE